VGVGSFGGGGGGCGGVGLKMGGGMRRGGVSVGWRVW